VGDDTSPGATLRQRISLGEQLARTRLANTQTSTPTDDIAAAGEAITVLLVHEITREGCNAARRLGETAAAALIDTHRALQANGSRLTDGAIEALLRDFTRTLLNTTGAQSVAGEGLNAPYSQAGAQLASRYRADPAAQPAQPGCAPLSLMADETAVHASLIAALLAFTNGVPLNDPAGETPAPLLAAAVASARATLSSPRESAWQDYVSTIIESFAGMIALALACDQLATAGPPAT
jgi:hypothetical protein